MNEDGRYTIRRARRLRKNSDSYQGTTSVVPEAIENTLGFSPRRLKHRLDYIFSAAC